jgi:hypothetical protein
MFKAKIEKHKLAIFFISVYLIAFISRIILIRISAWSDGIYYESAEIARFILAGQGYSWDWEGLIPLQPTAILPPIYTYFTAFFLYINQNPAHLFYITQAAINALGIIPSFYLGRQLAGTKVGYVSAIVYAIFPEIAFTSSKPAAESLLMPLIVLIFYLFLKFKERLFFNGKAAPFFWLGILIGFSALIKTTAAFIIPAGFASLVFSKPIKKNAIYAGFFLGFGFLIAIAPWSIRNTIVMDKPVLLNTMYGYNLWRGNHPWSKGTSRLDAAKTSEADLDPEYKKYFDMNHPNTEIGIDQFYLDEAKKFIRADIGRYIKLTFKRALYYLTFDPTHPLSKNIVYIAGYIFAVIFGVWGALLLLKSGKFDLIFLYTGLVFLVFYSPIIILPRYRLIFTWLLVALSSISVTNLLIKNRFTNRLLNRFT